MSQANFFSKRINGNRLKEIDVIKTIKSLCCMATFPIQSRIRELDRTIQQTRDENRIDCLQEERALLQEMYIITNYIAYNKGTDVIYCPPKTLNKIERSVNLVNEGKFPLFTKQRYVLSGVALVCLLIAVPLLPAGHVLAAVALIVVAAMCILKALLLNTDLKQDEILAALVPLRAQVKKLNQANFQPSSNSAEQEKYEHFMQHYQLDADQAIASLGK